MIRFFDFCWFIKCQKKKRELTSFFAQPRGNSVTFFRIKVGTRIFSKPLYLSRAHGIYAIQAHSCVLSKFRALT